LAKLYHNHANIQNNIRSLWLCGSRIYFKVILNFGSKSGYQSGVEDINDYKLQFSELNSKLDKILTALIPATSKKTTKPKSPTKKAGKKKAVKSTKKKTAAKKPARKKKK